MDARGALVRLGGWAHHVEALRARDAHAGPLRLAEGLGPSGPAGDPPGQGRRGFSWIFRARGMAKTPHHHFCR